MRADKIWSDEAAVHDFLLHGEVGHLTTIDSEGWPHTVPVDYVWHERAIFFHSGSGAKMKHLALNSKTAFAVTEALEPLTSEITSDNIPCHDTHLGRSVLIRGLAREIVDPAEKLEILNIIIAKYDPKAIRLGENLPGSESVKTQPGFATCRVVKIEVVELTACRLLLLNMPEEYRHALADHFEVRGLALDSARDLKTSILLRSVTSAPGR
ncbi:MAG: pyridoxamine 5'-phosphate oxidase family protein [Candidatus Adiutrix sp.]|jgi:nitroimidazol reductase NimA-like FMN-containing flavoprotein (pyridoxamine 5'-phosphate oxidase superfamily)|nr:pyridoxamine 5'-phosphate oxidase family protein [Candidatus Adiutrix sp.]